MLNMEVGGIHSGSNCIVVNSYLNSKECVIKIFKNSIESENVYDFISDQIIFIKKRLLKLRFNVPETIEIGIIRKNLFNNNFIDYLEHLYIVENYCGKNLISTKDFNKVKIKDEIFKLPENIPIDTNPKNICLLKNEIYFVDFSPPNPWNVPDQFTISYKKLFPNFYKYTYSEKKTNYFENWGRYSRYNYYLRKFKQSAPQ